MASPRLLPALFTVGVALGPILSCSATATCPTSPTPCPSVFTLHLDLGSLVGADRPLEVYRVTLITEGAPVSSALGSATGEGMPAPAASSSQRCVFTTPLDPEHLLPGCEAGDFTASIVAVTEATCQASFSSPGTGCSTTPPTTELLLRSARAITSLSIGAERGSTRFVPVKGAVSYAQTRPDGEACPGACTVADLALPFATLVDTQAMP